MDGNSRFAKGEAESPRRSPVDFRSVSKAQSPIAVVVACADSRVPPELLFDSGIGELFVVRVAGNVVEGGGVTMKGSIEYAVAELNVPLVVVLGHTNCGAVKAAVEHIDQKDSLPGSINGLVELIKPVVSRVQGQAGEIVENVTHANVAAGVERLKNLEPILAPRVKSESVKVVGGVYDLDTGIVRILKTESE
jgi:carbonic anhydrase